jgi:lipopolysaccharide transport system ATP-binding protein
VRRALALARLAFTVTTCITPEILLLDEWFGVSDRGFVEKAETWMKGVVEQSNIVVLTTHQIDRLKEFATRVIVLDRGGITADGPPEEILEFYKENYT